MADNKVQKKMSVTTESGFLCSNCGTQTVTYDKSTPDTCLNCGFPHPVLVWQDLIKDTSISETIPIDIKKDENP